MGSKKERSKLLGVVFGVGVSWVICAIGILILTQLVIKERIGESGVNLSIGAALMVSTLAGAVTASEIVGRNKGIIVLATSGIWMLTILSVSMLMDGEFQNALFNLIAVVIGSLAGCALCSKKQVKSRSIKRHNR